jgi:hypothetical protein
MRVQYKCNGTASVIEVTIVLLSPSDKPLQPAQFSILYLLFTKSHVLKAEIEKVVSGSHFIAAAVAVISLGFRMHKTAFKELGYGAHGAQHWINPSGGRHL